MVKSQKQQMKPPHSMAVADKETCGIEFLIPRLSCFYLLCRDIVINLIA
eukprot:UN23904